MDEPLIDISPEAILQLHEKKGMTYKEISELTGKTIGQVAGAIRYRRIKKAEGFEAKPELFDSVLNEPLKLEGDWIIIGDVHVPTVDYEFAQLPAMIANKHLGKEKNLLIAGDYFNMDHFSSYPELTELPAWKAEKEAAKHMTEMWQTEFTNIVFLMGNHDRRYQKFMRGRADDTDIVRFMSDNNDIVSTNYGWCTVETETGPWRVTHPKNYSIIQLNVADHLSQKYQSHIISHHEHHLAMGLDRYKRFVLINNGGLFSQKKMPYVMLDDSKNANMAQGFTMLRDGYPYVFGNEPFTRWADWL